MQCRLEDTGILESIIQNRFLDGRKDESDIRGIGGLGEAATVSFYAIGPRIGDEGAYERGRTGRTH